MKRKLEGNERTARTCCWCCSGGGVDESCEDRDGRKDDLQQGWMKEEEVSLDAGDTRGRDKSACPLMR